MGTNSSSISRRSINLGGNVIPSREDSIPQEEGPRSRVLDLVISMFAEDEISPDEFTRVDLAERAGISLKYASVKLRQLENEGRISSRMINRTKVYRVAEVEEAGANE